MGEPVEEGLFPRDRIPLEGCVLQPIGTSHADEQRGSEWDAVRKTRSRYHVGATGNIGQAKTKTETT